MDEYYGLNFIGKKRAKEVYLSSSTKELRINDLLSKNFDTTQNMVLIGDNLDCLKILRNDYEGRVKCIYIDPPYNTGNNKFLYRDRFTHSEWLSFMYPRLMLARDLLTKDGVIFISIDDNEQANLKLLCDEIFGEENFVEVFCWVKTSTPPALSNKSRKTIEYILCFERNKNTGRYFSEPLSGGDQPLLNDGNEIRVLKIPKDKVMFRIDDGLYAKGQYHRVELLNDIEIINGFSQQDLEFKGRFKWQQSFLDAEINNDTTFVIKSDKFSIRFQRNGDDGFKTPTNLIKEKYTSPVINKTDNEVGTNETGSSELEDLLGGKYFDFSKPVSLLKYLINFIAKKDDLILDFFAGSGTTGQAVMELNKDGGNRKFILCQIDEGIDPKKKKEAYDFCVGNNLQPVISSITVERLKRAGEKIQKEIGLFGNNLDIGYKVFHIVEKCSMESSELNNSNNVIPPRTNVGVSVPKK